MITYSLKHGDTTEISAIDFEITTTQEIRRNSVSQITEGALYM